MVSDDHKRGAGDCRDGFHRAGCRRPSAGHRRLAFGTDRDAGDQSSRAGEERT